MVRPCDHLGPEIRKIIEARIKVYADRAEKHLDLETGEPLMTPLNSVPEMKVYDLTCHYCGKQYCAAASWRKYCSGTCSNRAMYERQKQKGTR